MRKDELKVRTTDTALPWTIPPSLTQNKRLSVCEREFSSGVNILFIEKEQFFAGVFIVGHLPKKVILMYMAFCNSYKESNLKNTLILKGSKHISCFFIE